MSARVIEILLLLYWVGFVIWNLWLWKGRHVDCDEAMMDSSVDTDDHPGENHAKHPQ